MKIRPLVSELHQTRITERHGHDMGGFWDF